jgi:hypothetical protein
MKNSGVMDVMHIKKFAYYFYQSQTAHHNYDGSKSPMVHIANYYRSNSPLDRRIYTNCDSVRLFQNGTRIGTAKPDAGWNLAHPPVTFKGVNFVAGMLSAEGFIGGKVVARDSIRSPGTPSAIKLIADPDTIEANGSDISRIEAYVVDNNGTWIQYSSNPITFTCSGKGECIGDSPLAAQSGACITLAQAGLAAGAMTITASSSGLTSASVTVTVKNVSSTKNIGNRFPGNSGVMSRSTTINVKTLGNIIRLIPQVGQYGSNPFLVSVYDLNGKLLYKKITSERTIDLRKEIHRSEGITIVKSQPVESSLPANRN